MIRDINFSKYKRFFAFGCSFTGYIWPTWADVLSKEMPEAEYYNMGVSGAGNLMISARFTEANLKFRFNETDLVIVMWSTFCREDRYFHNAWSTPGNIFTQNTYSESFVKKFADPKGYLIRDLTLMSMATAYLKSLPCDSITLMSVPYNYQNETDRSVIPILESFSDLKKITPPCLFQLEMNENWDNGHSYFYEDINQHHGDYHPNPVRYKNYLEKIGFPLSTRSTQFANDSLEVLQSTKSFNEILTKFQDNRNGNHNFKAWW